MYSERPGWLSAVLDDGSRPAKLFAWDASNVDPDLYPANRVDHGHDLDRRIFVLGVGNLGRLFASYLTRSSDHPPITLVVRRKELLVEWLKSDGLEIERHGVVEKTKDVDMEWWTEELPAQGPVREVASGKKLRSLVITTKANAALPQVDRLRGYLDKSSTVAFVQNGMSKLWPPHGPPYVAHRFGEAGSPRFLACVTTHGVYSLGLFKSRHASPADIAVGPILSDPSGSVETFLETQLIEAPHLNGRSVPRPELWVLQLEKLVVNSINNPLTAILRCKNGVLYEQPDGIIGKIIDQLLCELSGVFQALLSHESSADILMHPAVAHDTENRDEITPTRSFSQQSLSIRFSQPNLRKMLYQVGHKVKENTSSMLQDVQAGRPTEVHDFNGWIVEIASFLDGNLDVSGHQMLVELVEKAEAIDVHELGQYFGKS